MAFPYDATHMLGTNGFPVGLGTTSAGPASFGCWVLLNNAANASVIGLSSTTNSSGSYDFRMVSNAFRFNQGGTESSAILTPALGVWHYVVACVGALNWASWAILHPSGFVTGSRSTNSTSRTAIDRLNLGGRFIAASTSMASVSATGSIAEAWWANVDIGNGAVLSGDLVWQLAFCGPHSVSRIVPNIVEYRSLNIPGGRDAEGQDFRGGARVGWAGYTTAAALIVPNLAPHPPLPASYIRPNWTGPSFGMT